MPQSRHHPVPPLEWAAAAFGLIVVLVLLGIISREAVTRRDDDVPILSVEAKRVVENPNGHVVEFVVRNRAGQTAAAVQIEGTARIGGKEETSSATVDYVPGRSMAAGGLIFPGDPRGAGLELRVTGYEIP